VIHDEIPQRASRASGRAIAIVVVCFFVGVVGMAAVAFKAGLLGPHARDADYVALATDAAAHQQWEAVRDLTDKGLAKSPRDATLLRVRQQASVDTLAAAKDKRDGGDAAGALRLAKLAAQLDPSSPGASVLVDELLAPPATPPVDSALPPLTGGRGQPPAAAATATAARATLDVSAAKPAVGQPVDFVARVAGGPRVKVESPAFQIAGPGIAPGTRLDATADGSGLFHGSFTFLQNGRYDVTFTAKADGSAVRTVRAVVVGDPKPPPAVDSKPSSAGDSKPPQADDSKPPALPPAQQGEPPSTAPSGSVRWM
jgi:hypothetical protein